MEKQIPKNYQRKSIDKLEKKLRKSITAAAMKHIGKKKVDRKNKSWMSDEIKEAIRERNELRKTISQNRKRWIEACKKVATMIREKKQKNWREYIEIDATAKEAQVWRTIRNIDGRNPPSNKNETLTVGGKTFITDQDKAGQFAKTYKRFSKLPTNFIKTRYIFW